MANLFDLQNRVAVVTGGNGGIGLGIAEALAGHGCAVSIWGRSTEKNTVAEERLRRLGGRVCSHLCDVTVREQVDHAVAATLSEFGRIDGCFANAGIGGGGRTPFAERTEDDWRQSLPSISMASSTRFSLSYGI